LDARHRLEPEAVISGFEDAVVGAGDRGGHYLAGVEQSDPPLANWTALGGDSSALIFLLTTSCHPKPKLLRKLAA
jgi:hypothetical protein